MKGDITIKFNDEVHFSASSLGQALATEDPLTQADFLVWFFKTLIRRRYDCDGANEVTIAAKRYAAIIAELDVITLMRIRQFADIIASDSDRNPIKNLNDLKKPTPPPLKFIREDGKNQK